MKTGKEYELDFVITEAMVERFAGLTGDYSSLHTDQSFARRSAFRENVVHGLLPVVFIPALSFPKYENSVWGLKSLCANFIKPVFLDDRLTLRAKITNADSRKNSIDFEFTVINRQSTAVLIAGVFTLTAIPRAGKITGTSVKQEECLLKEKLTEKKLDFEQINRGDRQAFGFTVTKACEQSLGAILEDGLREDKKAMSFSFSNLLASALASTFAGMCIPGKTATLLTYSVSFNDTILSGKTYRFEGEVTFKSSARTIIEDINIISEGRKIMAKGKINIKVNPPPVTVDSFAQLRKKALDLGLSGKVVLITGASRGIGETTAKLFALYGCKVIVNFCKGRDDAVRIVKEITENGGSAIAIQADVSDEKQVKDMVVAACKKYKTIDVLVNNAVRNFTPVDFFELTWGEIQKDIDVTIKGAFNCCKEVILLMLKNPGGRIINISSVATDDPPPNQLKYVISKSGLAGLSRALAKEFAAKNILVNTVVPNMVETDLTSGIAKPFKDAFAQEIPMQRIAKPLDVANAVVYLASSLSGYTTGQRVMVTGGSLPLL